MRCNCCCFTRGFTKLFFNEYLNYWYTVQIFGEKKCLLNSLTLQDQNYEVWNTTFSTLSKNNGRPTLWWGENKRMFMRNISRNSQDIWFPSPLTSFQNSENIKTEFIFFLMFSSNASIRCPHDLDVTSESSVWKLDYILVKYKQTTNLD